MGMVELGYSLQGCKVDWYKDYHVGNVCARRIGEGYTWVDIEAIKPITETFDSSLRKAATQMFRKSFLDHVPRHIRAYWMSLKPILDALSYKKDFLTHKTPALFAKIGEALQGAVPLQAPPPALFAKIGEALQGAVPLQAPWLEPRLHTEAASSSTTQFPWSLLKAGSASKDTEPRVCSEAASSSTDQLPRSEVDLDSASPNTEPQAQSEEQFQPQAQSSGPKRSKTEASDVPGENPADRIDGILAVVTRLKNRDSHFDGILAIVTRLNKELGVQVDPASSTSLSKSTFQAKFQDSQGNLFRYQPSATSIHHSQRGPEAHRHNEGVQYDSVFLIVMLLWEQLRKEYKKPAAWAPGQNNGYDSAVKFANKWSARSFVPWIKGLSKDHYQVVDVVELALSISECLEWKAQATDKATGYLSWLGFSLNDFDSTVVGAKVAKLAFQYLPSLPFLHT
jgi:hypothetical protein